MPEPHTISGIIVDKPTEGELKEQGVFSWPIWEKEKSTFDWTYDAEETCFFLEGLVTVKTDDGEVTVGQGDLVIFPKGLSCVWIVKEPVRKHYNFK